MELFNVGKIINTHGIRGEVKVKRISDFDDRFETGNTLYVDQPDGSHRKLTISGHRIHKGFDLLCFKEIGDINEAEKYKGRTLKVSEDQLTDLPENEFYYHEIIGCDVFLIDGEKLGRIKEILSPGANDVWVVQRDRNKDVLIPYIEDVVKEVDPKEKKIVIEPMEGLLD